MEADASGDEEVDVPAEELREEKLRRAKAWIVKWGLVFTVLIVIIWPVLSLPARKSSHINRFFFNSRNDFNHGFVFFFLNLS